ncbi:PREDICTED: venom acid phosphatase Acph-1-like [Nicrophorus vespilloides]|uniref:acid phosphatase n=1 Tax=Nicrophorus vespilloides TaxID=110193 RepID=A0ABM1MH33_NICVS|nr:PREDICTED: venom acid phosphatase Acph-1-like [Nicrophorus vespilloides]
MFKKIVFLFSLTAVIAALPDTELVQVHTIFRHGERTTYKFYPNDPNINDTFYPVGMGGLTNNGKMGEYKLGQFLRKMYNDFLGEHYVDGILEARSTFTARTLMSAQLVLAGLFPPEKTQLWNKDLPWQPIPVFSRLKSEEDLMHPDNCELKKMIMQNLPNRPEIQNVFIKPHKKLFEFIERNSGMPIRNLEDLIEFYFIVNTEDDLKLPMPEWVGQVYPEPLYSTAALQYSYANANLDLKRINAGYLLKKILDDSKEKIANESSNKNVKMYLYSGHESTIGFMLYSLKVLKTHIPPYGSAIIFELRKDSADNYYIQMRYRNKTDATVAQDLVIPGCASLCPIDQFIDLQKALLPVVSIAEACEITQADAAIYL